MAKTMTWQMRWELIPGWKEKGGQGFVHKVLEKGVEDGPIFILKELKIQNDPERRGRMRREVVVLETLPNPSTPRVIAHNTDCYKDLSIPLYAVFEFIPGPTLEAYLKEAICMSAVEAVCMVTRLLEILQIYHNTGAGHRDIKPDNIILRNGSFADPVLIDFGLTFDVGERDEEQLTGLDQQVGNRFLTLPEHSSISGNKRDLRSDLTFCVGILFFGLAGVYPAVLCDEYNRLPQQREEPRSRLDKLGQPERSRILHVFDRGFLLATSLRWQSIQALQDQLEKVFEVSEMSETEAGIKRLRQKALAMSGNQPIIDALEVVTERIKMAGLNAAARLGNGYLPEVERRRASMDGANAWIRCGIAASLEGRSVNTSFFVSAVGEEIIVEHLLEKHQRRIVARLPVADPNGTPPDLHMFVVDLIIAKVALELT